MFNLENYADGEALIVNDAYPYRSIYNAETYEAAVVIVVSLNQADMLKELASHRFSFETSGLSLGSDLQILTDRESQAQLGSAFTTLQAGLVPDTDWKAANGWESVNLEQIKPIATAVAAHVRGCFRGERIVEKAIKQASTVAEIKAIDIPVLFGAAYKTAYEEVVPG